MAKAGFIAVISSRSRQGVTGWGVSDDLLINQR
jgi:hypothetical protein